MPSDQNVNYKETAAILKESDRLSHMRAQSIQSRSPDSDSSGWSITDWLIDNDLSHDTVQANLILVGIVVIAVVISALLWLHAVSNNSQHVVPPFLRNARAINAQ